MHSHKEPAASTCRGLEPRAGRERRRAVPNRGELAQTRPRAPPGTCWLLASHFSCNCARPVNCHLVRPTLTISGIRAPLQLWKTLSRRPFDGVFAAQDALHGRRPRCRFARGGCCAAPGGCSQRAAQSGNLLRCRGRCIWAGLRTRWAQDASKPMLLASLLDAFLASAHAACGINIGIALSSASAHARGCGSEVASIYQPRADESARRVALKPVLAHACRPSEYMSVVSVVSMYQT